MNKNNQRALATSSRIQETLFATGLGGLGLLGW
jgi:hypothetical protein